MDKPLRNKIAQSFEQQYDDAFLEDHLPKGLWDEIADGLNDLSLPEGHSIKASFEEQHDDAFLEVALPAELWDQIERDLDTSVLPEGHSVKTSFEEQAPPPVPNAVWRVIEEELEITSVWTNIKHVLDQRTRFRYWREKAVQSSLLVLALLWMRGCHWEASYDPTPSTHPIAVQTPQGSFAVVPNVSSESKVQLPTATSPAETAIFSIAQQDIDNNATTEIKSFVRDEVEGNEALANRLLSKKQPLTTTQNTATVRENSTGSTEPANSSNTGPTHLITRLRKDVPTKEMVDAAKVIGEQLFQPSKQPTTVLTPVGIPFSRPALTTPPVSIVPFSEYKTHSVVTTTQPVVAATVEGLSLEPLGLPTHLDNPYLLFPDSEASIARQYHGSTMRWEMGLQARLSGSLFWGETTAKAMDATSMTTTEVQMTAGVGLVAAWHWSHCDALILSAHPSVSSRQYFGGYTSEGRYYHQQLTLTHAEGLFSYQRTLWRGCLLQEMPTRLYARVHYQLSHLTRGEELLNDERVEITQSYQRWQHSAGAALGISHQFRRWVLDVGGYGSYGLSSVSTHSNPIADSRLIQWGGYVGVRYVL